MSKTVTMNPQGSDELAKKFARSKATQIVGDLDGNATMRKRILPIRDFKAVIEHDKVYLGTLQELQAHLTLNEERLRMSLAPVIAKKNEQDIKKRAKDLVEWSRTKIELFDVRGQIEAHNSLINDKIFHFENIALKEFKQDCEKMENGEFEKQLDKSKSITTDVMAASTASDAEKSIINDLKSELFWWNDLEDSEKKDDEYKLYLFKAIKRLNNAYEASKEKK